MQQVEGKEGGRGKCISEAEAPGDLPPPPKDKEKEVLLAWEALGIPINK